MKRFLSVFALSLIAMPAWAEMQHEGHHASAPTSAYADVMTKMHEGMNVPATGDVDVDFVKGMIPHHQGAIDMAKVALEKSQDPFVRKLATDIVAAQEKEIAEMNAWLAAHEAAK